jgi:uncharacterized repeat protein (TIGR01451 family)
LSVRTSHSRVTVGDGTTVTFTVKNRGPDTDHGVVLAASIPGGLRLVSAHPSHGSCTGAAKITCKLGTLAKGKSDHVAVSLVATRTGDWHQRGSVTGSVKDPNLKNNHATASVTVTPPPCVQNLVFATTWMPALNVTTVEVIVDGRLRQTLHGSNLRRVKVRPLPATGVHSVTVMFIASPLATVTATRTYHGCASGPTTYSYPPQTGPGES